MTQPFGKESIYDGRIIIDPSDPDSTNRSPHDGSVWVPGQYPEDGDGEYPGVSSK